MENYLTGISLIKAWKYLFLMLNYVIKPQVCYMIYYHDTKYLTNIRISSETAVVYSVIKDIIPYLLPNFSRSKLLEGGGRERRKNYG